MIYNTTSIAKETTNGLALHNTNTKWSQQQQLINNNRITYSQCYRMGWEGTVCFDWTDHRLKRTFHDDSEDECAGIRSLDMRMSQVNLAWLY